jgi:hypothetical protein
MSNLTNIEKRKFETLFGMESGYVLDFSNRTFDEFVIDSTGLNIFEEKYNSASGSKANRLRAFWRLESNQIVAKLLNDLMQCVSLDSANSETQKTHRECIQALARLSGEQGISEVMQLTPNSSEREFAVLARAIRESIERNEPEAGLDRLHTYTVKYFRELCQQRGISTNNTKPLHSLVGEYIKTLRTNNHLDSEMTERILKSSISTLEAFNKVRNEQSLAHDNKMLNYEESLLIYNHVVSSIKFIEGIERKIATT